MAIVVDPPAPLIVTATMGADDFAWANGLRRNHFPPQRNHLPAHITLFHHLPPARAEELMRRLKREAGEGVPEAWLSEVMHLGNGVAFRIESSDLLAIRARIADAFDLDLIPQDRQTPRLHITVQNKVEAPVSKALFEELRATFQPRSLRLAGLALWAYRGGPWEALGEARFRRA